MDMATSPQSPRLRVLILASDCNPEWHSLPALTANFVTALSTHADLTLVTQVRNQANLEGFLPADLDVHYLDTERVARPIHLAMTKLVGDENRAPTLWVASRYPAYLAFEHAAWRRFRSSLRKGRFDVVHRVSPMSPTLPSPMASWSPVPFVLGPVVGGLPWPKVYKREMRREGEWLNYLRGAYRRLPYHASTYRDSAAVLAAYPHMVADLPPGCEDRAIEFSEGGIWTHQYPPRASWPDKAERTVLFVGRMVPFKQPEVLVRCFERSPLLKQHRLVLVGGGPELDRLRHIATEAGLGDRVTLTGAVSSDEVRRRMYEADVFAFPSIREQGGGVLTMASMASLPSVVVDYGGPSSRVPEGCGMRIPLGEPEAMIGAFTTALESLVSDPARIRRMGEAARSFTERHYDWDRKARLAVEVYDWVRGLRPHRPTFWLPPGGSVTEPVRHSA